MTVSEGREPSSQTVAVHGIPARYVVPDVRVANGRVAVWLPFLGGTKETFTPVLNHLARAGFFALSIDPRSHGERSTETSGELMDRVFGGFRANMWPLLGGTTLDAFQVIDWAIDAHYLSGDVVAGGVSMGGDIAVALAGIDRRVSRVAAIAATPDWTRPGMTQVGQPENLIDQGEPTGYGRWLYDALSPVTNLHHYTDPPSVRPYCSVTFAV